MLNKFVAFFKTQPLFIFLLPVFFVLHGVVENYDFVSLRETITLITKYVAASCVLAIISLLFFKNWLKASILSFLCVSLHFFFGSIIDTVKKINENSALLKYSIILPIIVIFLVVAVLTIKRAEQLPTKLSFYLNTVFSVLIVFDIAMLTAKEKNLKKEKEISISQNFSSPQKTSLPDIYFIILDEYAGHKELKDQLGFDNSNFENELHKQGFFVIPNSTSNYISTPLSVASFLTMDYQDMKGIDKEQNKVLISYKNIRKSIVPRYFKSIGYKIYNYSIFDLPEAKTQTQPTFLPTGKDLITSQTFLSRLKTDLGFHLYTTLGFKENIGKHLYTDLSNNNNLYALTFNLASQKAKAPKFCYTHLMIPHYPYYHTSTGKQRPLDELLTKNKQRPDYYLEYLIYCNTRMLTLIKEIREKSSEAIIIVSGDHGFRNFDKEVNKNYFFYTLCAVHLPSGDYKQFYEGLSSVNLFRLILNTEFQQQLPLLKDSLVLNH